MGKITGILGLNGAGKTTLFNIINHEFSADNGEILLSINDKQTKLTPEDVGMVFTENYLPEFMTGYEFINLFLKLYPSDNQLTCDDYLDLISFSHEDRHQIIKNYSSGMRSKLSLLTVIIMKPRVILLDEPLSSIDLVSSFQLKQLFKTLKNDHIILISTHIIQIANDLCDDIVLLREGHLETFDHKQHKSDFEETLIKELGGQ